QSMPPRMTRVDVVVEICCPELHVGVPAIAHEFTTYCFTSGMLEAQGRSEPQSGPIDRFDSSDFERAVQLHPHADERARLEPRRASQRNTLVRYTDGGGNRLTLGREWPHRLLIVESGVDSVTGLHVELHEMDMDVDFAPEGVIARVLQFALQQDI